MRKINLGCGNRIANGYENYDIFPVDERVKYIDLNMVPYPFPDNSMDEIILSHTLEHLKPEMKPFVMDELIRICKPGGVLKVTLPTFENGTVHTSYYHDLGYLYGYYSKRKSWNTHHGCDVMNGQGMVSLVKLQKTPRSLGNLLGNVKNRFLSWIGSFLFHEYTWVMKKQ